MSTVEYHSELVEFVIEAVFDSRLHQVENVLGDSANFAQIAHAANEKFHKPHVRALTRCFDHSNHVTAEDVATIFQRFKESQQKAKEKFIAEHVRTVRRK